jgi:hypothetical protein
MSKPEEFKFDSRVRDRFLRGRVLSQAELQKHLEELPDLEGQYELMNDMPQPAVAPPRSEVAEEPLVFDGIRRLQALGEVSSPAPAPRYVPPSPPASSGLPAYREESRPLGTPLRSALMESEISGVGAGAVSAALGAMAAEARGASVFGVPASIPQAPTAAAEESSTPVTLRSDAAPSAAEAAAPSEPERPEPSIASASSEEDVDDAGEDDLDDDGEDDDLDDDDGDDEDADADEEEA